MIWGNEIILVKKDEILFLIEIPYTWAHNLSKIGSIILNFTIYEEI